MTWALVVGIDRYDALPPLQGANDDARAFHAWLVSPDGGRAPEAQARLLLDPDHASLVAAMRALLHDSDEKGERLYLYFAGHGLSANVDGHREDVLLPRDFSPGDTTRSIRLSTLVDDLKVTGFNDQFFFIDACRAHVPWTDAYRFGAWPQMRVPPAAPAVQQFLCLATSPGASSVELDDGGVFTQALLDGLRGAAKVLDPWRERTVVSFGSLFDYVRRRVTETAADDAQIPRRAGEQGAADRSADPCLVEWTVPQPRGGRRFCLAFTPDAAPDRALAAVVRDGLRRAGQLVYDGTIEPDKMRPEIERADALVVLLSAETACSELVRRMVRVATDRSRTSGRPTIVPLRVGAGDGPAPSWLPAVRELRWVSEADTSDVLRRLIVAANAGTPLPPELSAPRPTGSNGAFRPDPTGTMAADDPYYLHRNADDRAQPNPGAAQTIVIKAPRQMGKSSLLTRYLRSCAQMGRRTALVDLREFLTLQQPGDYGAFLTNLGLRLHRQIRGAAPRLSRAIRQQSELTDLVEDHLVTDDGADVVVALDECDRLLDPKIPFREDFFRLLRYWHDARAEKPKLARLSLALVIQTDAGLLMKDALSSPFNVGIEVELQPFALAQTLELNERLKQPLKVAQVKQLEDLLGGHPFLTRLAFYRLTGRDDLDFAGLMRAAADEDGPFGDHLLNLRLKVGQRKELLKELRDFVKGLQRKAPTKKPSLSKEAQERLRASGIIRVIRTRNGAHVEMANRLYEAYFSAALR
jgi:hypothetical protein